MVSSDEEEKRAGIFLKMTPEEKDEHIKKRWRTVWNLAQGVVVMLRLKEVVMTKISLFGRQLLAEQLNSRTVREQKTCACIIMPYSKFKLGWNMLVILLLLYSLIYVPVQVAFLDLDKATTDREK